MGVSRGMLENVRLFAAHAKAEKADGMATTVWLPQRYVPGVLGTGIAYAADQSWNPGGRDLKAMAAAYLVQRFGLEPTPERVDRVDRMGDVGMREGVMASGLWSDSPKLLEHAAPEGRAADAAYEKAVCGLTAGFEADLKQVKRNRPEFESLALAAALAEHLALRRDTAAQVVSLIREVQQDPKSAPAKLSDAAGRIRLMEKERASLFARMQKMWDRDRYPEDPERAGAGSQNLYWWFGSRDVYGYAEDLAATLEALAKKPEATEISAILLPKEAKPR